MLLFNGEVSAFREWMWHMDIFIGASFPAIWKTMKKEPLEVLRGEEEISQALALGRLLVSTVGGKAAKVMMSCHEADGRLLYCALCHHFEPLVVDELPVMLDKMLNPEAVFRKYDEKDYYKAIKELEQASEFTKGHKRDLDDVLLLKLTRGALPAVFDPMGPKLLEQGVTWKKAAKLLTSWTLYLGSRRLNTLPTMASVSASTSTNASASPKAKVKNEEAMYVKKRTWRKRQLVKMVKTDKGELKPIFNEDGKPICFKCYEYGHMQSEHGARAHVVTKNYDVVPHSLSSSSSSSPLQNIYDSCYSANSAEAVMSVTRPNRLIGKVIVDSGCSNHISCVRDDFDELSLREIGSVILADGSSKPIEGEGLIRLKVKTIEGDDTIIQYTALYIPSLAARLFSVKKATEEQGFKIVFDKNQSFVTTPKGVKIQLMKREGVYIFNNVMNDIRESQHGEQVHVNHISKPTQDLEILHQRLGHARVNPDGTLYEVTPGKLCIGCVKGKAKQQDQTKGAVERKTKLGELIHVDTFGPLERSCGGLSYFLCFVDSCTRYCWTRAIKARVDIPAEVELFIMQRKAERIDVQCLFSDGAPEFMSKEFTTMLAKNGATHRYTPPNTPAVNGLAERGGGRISEIVRCMLHGSCCSMKLWPYAVMQAAIVLNALPRRLLHGKTPYELVHNEKFDVNVLRVFGCRAFVVDDYAEGKLSSRVLECIYIGYDEQSKSHRVFMPNGTTRRSQSVICDEAFTKRNVEEVIHSEAEPNAVTGSGGVQTTHDEDQQPQASSAPSNDVRIGSNSIEDVPELEDPRDYGDGAAQQVDDNNGDTEEESALNEAGNEQVIEHKRDDSAVQEEKQLVVSNDEAPTRVHEVGTAPKGSVVDQFGVRRSTRLAGKSNANVSSSPLLTDIDVTKGIARVIESSQVIHASAAKKASRKGGACHVDLLLRTQGRLMSMKDTAMLVREAVEKEVIPRSYDEAHSSKFSEKWAPAFTKELNAMKEYGVWHQERIKPDDHVLDCKWVITMKHDGTPKARLVLRGYRQVPGEDFELTYAPVGKLTSLRVLIAWAAHHRAMIEYSDWSNAFLNAPIAERLVVKAPEGVTVQDGCGLVLDRALYGAKQAPHAWHDEVNSFLTQELHMVNANNDECLYVWKENNEVILLYLYVDDCVYASTSQHLIEKFKTCAGAKYKIKHGGQVKRAIGIDIQVQQDFIKLSQTEAIDKLIQAYKLDKEKPRQYPIVAPKDEDQSSLLKEPTQYRSLIGSLNFIVCCTRPDCAYALSVLSQRMHSPSEWDMECALNTLLYLKRTRELGLVYKCSSNLSVVGCTDANWGPVSMSGYVFMMGGTPISWSSKRQHATSLSSAESELYAASQAAQEAIFLKLVLGSIGIMDKDVPMELCIDNSSAKALIEDPKFSSALRHIVIRNMFVAEKVKDGLIVLKYVPSENNCADVLTKPTSGSHFVTLLQQLLR